MLLTRLLSSMAFGLTLTQATPLPDPASSDTTSAPAGADAHTQPAQYFQESSFSIHYDPRFASASLNTTAERAAARVLVQTYLSTLRDLGVQTWLAHGSLLGWWWNKQSLPWDVDADVQISERGLRFLAAYYNMTTWYYKYPSGVPAGRYFQLEVSPHYTSRTRDENNAVDARWIDMDSGLFIDIAGVSRVEARGGVLASKDGREVREAQLFPLLETTFEGVRAKIPFQYEEMLASEYGERALTDKVYKDHKFIDSEMEWVPSEEL
ncbi:Protein MNN4 [Colletotrichum spinosum]|uniref:Protein MNN4 n=1 Tax=Colletotrichum spinosum TaxID=1347390 RepID=A0A4V3HR63_9PEZI|nr:Protein MNN4 [Colletotrichum spinosum]